VLLSDGSKPECFSKATKNENKKWSKAARRDGFLAYKSYS
jgi:hypothetical protein